MKNQYFNYLKIYILIFSILILWISSIWFNYIYSNVATDLQAHVKILTSHLSEGLFPVPPAYYFLIYILNQVLQDFGKSTVVLLSLSMVAKYIASIRISNLFKVSKLLAIFILICVLIFAPISFNVDSHFSVGKIGSNVWHNSTTLLLMPFALLLFYESFMFLEEANFSKRKVLVICLLILVNALIKPSFLFAFVPAFFIIVIFFYRNDRKKVMISTTLCFYATLCVVAEYLYIYIYNLNINSDGGISLSFIYIWRLYSNTILLDIVTGLSLPITVFVLFYKKVISKRIYLYSVLLFIMALLIYLFVQESGSRATHANFGWQVIICNYILFLVSTCIGLEHVEEKGINNKKSLLFFIIFILHFISGILYLVKIATKYNYY